MREEPLIFRKEALESHRRGSDARSDLLRISPKVTEWTYWLLIAFFLAGFVYLFLGRVDEYATGTGLIRDEGRTMVTAIAGGTIREIAVQPGEKVEARQPLVYFSDVQERIELERLTRDYNAQQINRLRNPNDAQAHQQVAGLRTQIEAAEKHLADRTLVAPRAGVVQDIRIHPNQLVNAGELVLTIVGENDALDVVAILPGSYRPLLRKGDVMRLELTGFRYAYQQVTIDEVGNEVVGPNEIRRFLGQEVSDSFTLEGSSVIVRAHLPSRRFQADGGWHEYHDGMHATAEARVRSQSILAALVPGMRAVVGSLDD